MTKPVEIKEGVRYCVRQKNKPDIYMTCSYANSKQAWFKSDNCKDTDYRFTFDDQCLHKWVLVGWDKVDGELVHYETIVIEYVS